MLGPAVVTIFFVFIIPVILLFTQSFQTVQLGSANTFVGLQNYATMLDDSFFHTSLRHTMVYSVGSLVVSLFAGLLIALSINRVKSARLRSTYLVLTLLSWAIPLLASGLIWRYMLNTESGLVNFLLMELGLIDQPIAWLVNRTLAMMSVILLDSWIRIPFVTVILYAGRQSISESLYEAVRVDGGNIGHAFRHVTLPALRPSLFLAALLTWMFAFRTFGVVFTLTGGGPGTRTEVIATYIYDLGLQTFQLGYASALSVFLVIIVMLIATFMLLREGDN